METMANALEMTWILQPRIVRPNTLTETSRNLLLVPSESQVGGSATTILAANTLLIARLNRIPSASTNDQWVAHPQVATERPNLR